MAKAMKRARIKRYEVSYKRLDRGGYDSHGHYWGVGQKLYEVFDNDSGNYFAVRAPNAKEARESVFSNPNEYRIR